MAVGGAKRKVTLRLDAVLLDAIDQVAKQHGSRSGAIERVLQDWYREQQLEQLNHETEQYYRSLTASERLEDRAWSDLSSTQVGRLWD